MSQLNSQIGSDGSVIIPPRVLEELDLRAGSEVEFRVQEGSVRILPSVHERVRRAQERVKKYIRPGESIVDELIAERRLEAKLEAENE